MKTTSTSDWIREVGGEESLIQFQALTNEAERSAFLETLIPQASRRLTSVNDTPLSLSDVIEGITLPQD
jgi:hypothetical protein